MNPNCVIECRCGSAAQASPAGRAEPRHRARHSPRSGRDWPRHMDEHRTAPAGDARPGVVVDLDDEIVQPVATPQPVPWFIGRPPERTIVAPVGRILAPRDIRGQPACRQARRRTRQAVGPPPQPAQPEAAQRGAAVALPLVGQDAAAAEHDRDRPTAGQQYAPGAASGPGADADQRVGAAPPALAVPKPYSIGQR